MTLATVLRGRSERVLATLPAASFDALVTDPPAGIGFMGKAWDRAGALGGSTFIASLRPVFAESLRVLRPGAWGLVWALPRTSHWTAMALEQAGFEIRDSLHHVFGQGWPKAETQLKPAHEVWWLCRTPGPLRPLQIDACRVPFSSAADEAEAKGKNQHGDFGNGPRPTYGIYGQLGGDRDNWDPGGRWPTNLVLTHAPGCAEVCALGCPAAALDAHAGPRKAGSSPAVRRGLGFGSTSQGTEGVRRVLPAAQASRFFPALRWAPEDLALDFPGLYCPKARRKDRTAGCPDNDHPTVKPLALMRWLLSLITPPGGAVLDPFCGTGTTLVAAEDLGLVATGIDKSARYCRFAEKRLAHARQQRPAHAKAA